MKEIDSDREKSKGCISICQMGGTPEGQAQKTRFPLEDTQSSAPSMQCDRWIDAMAPSLEPHARLQDAEPNQ